jgi:hypothetical protein
MCWLRIWVIGLKATWISAVIESNSGWTGKATESMHVLMLARTELQTLDGMSQPIVSTHAAIESTRVWTGLARRRIVGSIVEAERPTDVSTGASVRTAPDRNGAIPLLNERARRPFVHCADRQQRTHRAVSQAGNNGTGA